MTDHPLLLFCPFPTVQTDGSLVDGTMLKQSVRCRMKCDDRTCSVFPAPEKESSPQFYTCDSGYSVVVVRVGDVVIRVNGVVEVSSNKSAASFKKQNKQRKIKATHLSTWISAFKEAQTSFNNAVDKKAQDAVHALHDIKSLIGSILKTSEQFISEQEGESISEKIDNSPELIQTIYHSCEILESLLQITDILTNPAVVQFGNPRPVRVHRALLKLLRIQENRAEIGGKKMALKGESHSSVRLYNSFILIPHIMIDNAIKHSDPRSEIRITIRDWADGSVSVKFSSFGRLVPENEQLRIFERGVRGSNARREGSGLGLYIAQIVAKANGFTISYKANTRGILGQQRGDNQFTFTIPKHGACKSSSEMPRVTRSVSKRSVYG